MIARLQRLAKRLVQRTDDTDAFDTGLTNHTIVLGWGPVTPTVVAELTQATEGRLRPAILVVGEEEDSVTMSNAITAAGASEGARLVLRTGRPSDSGTLQTLHLERARAVVVLPGQEDDPDRSTLHTLDMLADATPQRPVPYHSVVTLHDPSRLGARRTMAGTSKMQVVLIDELVARVVAHCCLQPGLAGVFEELLTYAGNEVYFAQAPQLTGLTFGEALYCYEASIPIGLRRASGPVELLPPMGTRIAAGDQLIAISANQNTTTVALRRDVAVDEQAIRTALPQTIEPQRVFIVGWHRRAPLLLKHLDACLPVGSALTIVVRSAAEQDACREHHSHLRNVVLSVELGEDDERMPDRLAQIDPHHIVVIARSGATAPSTMATADRLRLSAWRSDRPFSLVAEIDGLQDPAAADRRPIGHDEWLRVERLVGLVVSQVSGSLARADVFEELLDVDGPELQLTPIERYVSLEQPVTFYTLLESARRRNEIAIGYRRRRDAVLDASRRTVLNPHKRALVEFEPGDQLLVLTQRQARQGLPGPQGSPS